jgi:hypothetical protein
MFSGPCYGACYGAPPNFAHVMTTEGFIMPTQCALRGGLMNGADCISLAPLMQ